MGISVYSPGEYKTDIKDIIKKADQALYIAKEKGKNAYQIST
ncbi:diguanylate cyclase domain-containing protein [Filobacillus milosensis]